MNAEHFYGIEPRQWFALRVKSGHEKLIATSIRLKGFEEFLPLYKQRHRWSDRLQSIELPLFPGYVFCHIDPTRRLPILIVPGVLHFVGIGKTPIPIDDAEIGNIQIAVRSGLAAEPTAYLEVGQRVRLDDGPLAGLEGSLVELRNKCRVVVSVSLLRRSLAVEIERDWVTPLDTKPAHATCSASRALSSQKTVLASQI